MGGVILNVLKMEKKIFGLLILCGILSQGIYTSSEQNEKSSDLHIRTKRLIGNPTHITEAPFLVSIMANGLNHCPATLLTNNAAITSAECLKLRNTKWNLHVGPSIHNISRVIRYGNYSTLHPTINNLAIVLFQPSVNHSTTHNRPITIYSGLLAAEHDNPVIYNWNHLDKRSGMRRQSAFDLQSVFLKFISIGYCQYYYPNRITNENICTQSFSGEHYCEHLDSGAPLILRQQLIGILVYRGQSCKTDPDVFMNLLDLQVRFWIHQHIPTLRLY